jgi:prephenate dehydrogenase
VSHEVGHLAVIGAGLVGGSIALAARAAGVGHVSLTDADPAVVRRAAALGLADEVTSDLAAAVAGAEVVIAAVPASAVADVLAAAALHATAAAILTDAASLKADLTVEVEARLTSSGLHPERFVGGHPMAGSERSGPEAADASLFQGATWVLTPTATSSDDALQALSSLLRRLGARVLVLPGDRHDELVAIVSHLPQIAASVLADVAADAVEVGGDAVLAVAGGGFRDTTRIAASDPELWLGILRGNRGAVLDALGAYRARLGELHEAIASDDAARIGAILQRASDARRRLVPKAGVTAYADLVVPLDDRPGALADVTTALGEAGVNVEDLAMRHAADGSRGALVVRVTAEVRHRAIEVLVARGLRAHLEGEEHLGTPGGATDPAGEPRA